MRACAVKTHANISHEPLYTEIYRKNAAAQIEPRTRTHTLCKLAQSKCTSTFHKSHLIQKFKGKMPPPRLTHTHTRPTEAAFCQKRSSPEESSTQLPPNTEESKKTKKHPQNCEGFGGRVFWGKKKTLPNNPRS